MGQQYSSLSIEVRTQLELLLQHNLTQRQIAVQLGRSASTISRELSRHRHHPTGRYMAAAAQSQAGQRRSLAKAGCRKLGTRFDTALGKFVLHELQRALSPEQIAGRLKHMHPDDPTQCVSHETIYSAVYMVPRGELRTQMIAALGQSHDKRLPRARGTSRKGNIADLVPLSERPAEVDSREVPGHWEGDFIKGARNASAIGTAVERHSPFVLLTQMNSCTATHAPDGFTRGFNGRDPRVAQEIHLRPRQRNGSPSETERCHRNAGIRMPVYFCEPYSPWQRGSNENMNGLVRQFLPKGMDLSTVTPQKLAYIETMLNDQPRKILGFRTPSEVYTEMVEKLRAQRSTTSTQSVALQI